jgi:hypothetical protein
MERLTSWPVGRRFKKMIWWNRGQKAKAAENGGGTQAATAGRRIALPDQGRRRQRQVEAEPFATFGYIKEVGDQQIPIDAVVFPIRVKRLKADYKERKERKRKWLSAEDAAEKLDDSGLRSLVTRYAEKLQDSDD